MSDYIKKEDVLQAIAGLLNVVEQIDSADVVEVVRCKDCKHCEKRRTANYQPFFYCLMQECSIKDNDYCGYAERKTNDE